MGGNMSRGATLGIRTLDKMATIIGIKTFKINTTAKVNT
jgi:hypothetical protein